MAASKESPIPTAAVSVAACAVDVGESDEAGCFFCLFDAALPLPPAAAFAAAAAAFLAAFCVRIYADLLGEGREAEVQRGGADIDDQVLVVVPRHVRAELGPLRMCGNAHFTTYITLGAYI